MIVDCVWHKPSVLISIGGFSELGELQTLSWNYIYCIYYFSYNYCFVMHFG